MRWLVAALLMGLFLCTPALAQTCQFSLDQEKAKWTEQGLSVGEADPVQVVKAIEIRYGEKIEADQVFVLSKPGAPNVAIVFVKDRCPHSVLVMSVADYQAMLQAVSL